MKCNQCELSRIQGVVCHETGCPNSGKTWDEDRESWIKYVDCFTCGYPVEVGEACDCTEHFEDEQDRQDANEDQLDYEDEDADYIDDLE